VYDRSVATVLVLSDRFFRLPPHCLVAIWIAAAATVFTAVWILRRRLDVVTVLTAGVLVVATTGAAYGYFKLHRRAVWRLGKHLPTVALLEPKAGQALAATIALRAHATDEPGSLGVEPAVRSIEFWLYHPSFGEQHAGNRESKVMLAAVPGPSADDEYEASWTCSNPYTPPRDGDHSGGDGTRTYTLPADGRPYSIQAHGIDDEWRAKPGRPGVSERVTVQFHPCD
jgi:hypothetical protein